MIPGSIDFSVLRCPQLSGIQRWILCAIIANSPHKRSVNPVTLLVVSLPAQELPCCRALASAPEHVILPASVSDNHDICRNMPSPAITIRNSDGAPCPHEMDLMCIVSSLENDG